MARAMLAPKRSTAALRKAKDAREPAASHLALILKVATGIGEAIAKRLAEAGATTLEGCGFRLRAYLILERTIVI